MRVRSLTMLIGLLAGLVCCVTPRASAQWERFPVTRGAGAYADANLTLRPDTASPSSAAARSNAAALQRLLNDYAVVEFRVPGDYYFGSPTSDNEGIIIPSNRTLVIGPGVTLWQHSAFYGGSVAGHDYYALFRFAGSTKTTNVVIAGGGRIGRDTPAGADDAHLVRLANYDNVTIENITFYRRGNTGKYCFYSSYGKNLTLRNCRALGDMNEMLASPAVDSLGYACKSDGFHLSGFHDGVRMETSGSSGDNLNAFLSDEGADYANYWGQYDRKGSIRNARVVTNFDRSAEPIRCVGQSYDFGITGCDWTAATKTLTKTGAFAGYWLPGSIIRPTGSGVTAGEYLVIDQTGDDSIVLATSLAAGNLSGTVNLDAPTLAVTGATWTASTKTITKTSAFGGVAAGDWVRITWANNWDTDARVASSTANTLVLVDSIYPIDISSIAVNTGRTFQPVIDLDVDGATGSLKVGALSALAVVDDGNLNGARMYLRAKNIKVTRADAAATVLKLTCSGIREVTVDGVEVPDNCYGVLFGYANDCDRASFTNVRSTQTANSRHLFQIGSAPRTLNISNCELNSTAGSAYFALLGSYLVGGTDLIIYPRVKISNCQRRGAGTGNIINQYGYGPGQVLDGQISNCSFEGGFTRFLNTPGNTSPSVGKRSTWQVDNVRIESTTTALTAGQVDSYWTNWLRLGTGAMPFCLDSDTGYPTASLAPEWITYTVDYADVNSVGNGLTVDVTLANLTKFATVPTTFRNLALLGVKFDWTAAWTGGTVVRVGLGSVAAPTGVFAGSANTEVTAAVDTYIFFPAAGLTATSTADIGWVNANWQPTLRFTKTGTAGVNLTAGRCTIGLCLGGSIGTY